MMQPETPFQVEFTSHVLFDPAVSAGYMKHYVPIPDAVAAQLDAEGITHVEGLLNAHPFRRVLHTRPEGDRCLKFGKTWLDQADLDIGAEVRVMLRRDEDPDHVDLPDELSAELEREPHLLPAWWALSPSRRKSLVYSIDLAKRPETRQKRARAILDDLRRTATLWG